MSEVTAREPKGAGAAWTEERGTSDEGRERSVGGRGGGRGPEASGKIEPGRLRAGIRTAEGVRFLRGLAGKRVRQNGCAAAAYAALYANVDVITAYPIRPYTAIMMNLAQFIADGILDAEYIHADGEHSQFSAAFGAGSCGARAYTGSSGVGVTYGYEMYSIISGARIPVQMAIADRTLDPPGDFGSEHTDALCTRDMGWLLGWAATPQEVFDKSLLAYAIGEDPRVLLPQMVVQDGYFVSHIAGEVEMPSIEQVDGFLPPYQLPFALDPRRPLSHGPQIHPEQGPPLQLERARAMEDAIPVIRDKTDEFARVFGRAYPHFVESYLLDDAEIAIVISGGHAVTCRAAVNRLRAQGVKIGMARLLWVRPFPSEDLRAALAGVKAVGVVETNLGLGGASYGGILSLDVTTALYQMTGERPLVTSFMAGLGGETVPMAEFDWMAGKLAAAVRNGRVEKAAHWVGFEE
jgi:pyruvate/2-oxoacid:ferredoxin oxidoreductase alpha subunit